MLKYCCQILEIFCQPSIRLFLAKTLDSLNINTGLGREEQKILDGNYLDQDIQ